MRFLTQASLATLLATRVLGHPAPSSGSIRGRTVDLSAFKLKTEAIYSDVASTIDAGHNLPSFDGGSYTDTATDLVKELFPKAEFRLVSDHYIGNDGIGHVNFKQTVHGLDIDNSDFNVNIGQDGSVFSYGNSFYTGVIPTESPLKKRDQVDPIIALKAADSTLNLGVSTSSATAVAEGNTEKYIIKGSAGALKDPEARLVYFKNDDNTLSLTWRLETDISDNWLLTYVDAVAPEKVFGVVDYVSDAIYTVYPWKTSDPSKGSRVAITNPDDLVSSEFTWLGVGTTRYTTTRGNNGIAQGNFEGDTAYLNDYRPTSATSNFTYPFSLTQTTPRDYADAAITQLFYTSNAYHDLLYRLGFTERAGNFETNNNGQGGLGNDAVILNAQDGSGTNNANFATPVDGSAPRMRMYIWTYTTPYKIPGFPPSMFGSRSNNKTDSSFDAGVVIHEYTHGLTNRLTGGPANSGCLSVTEAGGMGEGWSDFFAIAIHLKTTDTRATNYPMGAWIRSNTAGIRAYLYSTSLTTNPMTYTYANGQTAVHYIGTIWASILYEVLWNLIDRYGITNATFPTFTNGIPTDGRFLALQLVLNGLTLQPCNPTFIQARNAIIDADTALTGGANRCLLWTAFAKRGLGSGAARGTGTSGRTGSTTIPAGVC